MSNLNAKLNYMHDFISWKMVMYFCQAYMDYKVNILELISTQGEILNHRIKIYSYLCLRFCLLLRVNTLSLECLSCRSGQWRGVFNCSSASQLEGLKGRRIAPQPLLGRGAC